jgi:hypothetical protein
MVPYQGYSEKDNDVLSQKGLYNYVAKHILDKATFVIGRRPDTSHKEVVTLIERHVNGETFSQATSLCGSDSVWSEERELAMLWNMIDDFLGLTKIELTPVTSTTPDTPKSSDFVSDLLIFFIISIVGYALGLCTLAIFYS